MSRDTKCRVRRALPSGLWLSVVLWSLVACAGPSSAPPASTSPSGGMVVTGARAHLLPGGHGAIYLEVTNGGPEDRLMAVETPLAAVAEMHESLDDQGVMRMVAHGDGFAVPGSGQLKLEPGGKHIMLMQIQPVEGETVPLTLRFELAGDVETTAQVLGIPGATEGAGMDHGSMDHGSMDHGSIDHNTTDHEAMQHGDMHGGAMDPGPMDRQVTDHSAVEHRAIEPDPDGSLAESGH